MKFNYKARAKNGTMETGTIEAYSKEAVAFLLQKDNLFVTSIEEQVAKESFFTKIIFDKKVSKKELAIFFRQLSVMLESRVPVVQSILSLADQTTKAHFKKTLLEISKLVEQGVPLSDALSAYPKVFDKFYINLVKSGEASSKISSALFYISENLEREDDISAQVRQALIYPIFLIAVLFVVVSIIIVGVMPKIADLIKESGNTPPAFTVAMLSFYKFLGNYWWAIVLVFFILIALAIYYFNTQEGGKKYDAITLKIPFMGSLFKKVFLARLCGNVSTLLVAGISINNALKITEDTVNNVVYKKVIAQIGKEVSEGEKISSAMLENPDYFPRFVVQMIKVGEETGKLDKTLMEVVGFYQKDIKRMIDLFTRFLEPLMIIVLGIVVTALAISVLSSLYGAIGTI